MAHESEEDKQEEQPEEKEETKEGKEKKEMTEEETEEVPEEVESKETEEEEAPLSKTDEETEEGEIRKQAKKREETREEQEVEEKDIEEEKRETEENEEVSYPDTDELSTSRMFATGLRTILISILLTSVLYVLATTGIGNLAWQGPARGNLVEHNGEVVGSRLIGQSLSSDKYFHPRPSSKNYDAMDSGSANLSPGNEKLTRRARDLLEDLEEEGVNPEGVPVSFVTESGSALDPHIVPESAYLQVPRVSEATGIDPERLRELIDENTKGKFVGLYGLERVNVLSLNIEIEKILESG